MTKATTRKQHRINTCPYPRLRRNINSIFPAELKLLSTNKKSCFFCIAALYLSTNSLGVISYRDVSSETFQLPRRYGFKHKVGRVPLGI